MRVYQSIHKYPPHIPAFEGRQGITDDSDISFSELQRLIIEDGYADVYRLEVSKDDNESEVFFTIWNYERLQFLWAQEHGLDKESTMNEIRVAQVKWFKPDVIYDFSGRYRPDFIAKLKQDNVKAVYALWNGVIEKNEIPASIPGYDLYISLHQPYIDYWTTHGQSSFELQPAIPQQWKDNIDNDTRSIDILMYGQSNKEFFQQRDEIISKVIELNNKYNVSIKLQMDNDSKEHFAEKLAMIKAPVYGKELYDVIQHSKIVINKCTDNNLSYKSNMRVFEAIGNGALLLTEQGQYPEHLTPDEDFLTYSSSIDLLELIDSVLMDWERWSAFAKSAENRMKFNFNKEKQWVTFYKKINSYLSIS